MLPYTDKMSFTERWYNAVITTFDAIIRRFKYIPTEESIAQKFFAHLAPLPPLTDLMSSISVMFVNNHRALSPPRPAMPGAFYFFSYFFNSAESIVSVFLHVYIQVP